MCMQTAVIHFPMIFTNRITLLSVINHSFRASNAPKYLGQQINILMTTTASIFTRSKDPREEGADGTTVGGNSVICLNEDNPGTSNTRNRYYQTRFWFKRHPPLSIKGMV